jgi:signal peptidase I
VSDATSTDPSSGPSTDSADCAVDKPPISKRRKLVRELCVFAVLAFVLLSARSSLADHYRVPTGSMLPTVEIDDRILVNKAAYGLRVPFTSTFVAHFDGPRIGDAVVLRSPEDGKVLLKRIIAVPGTTVEVRGGHIALDGRAARIEERDGQLIENLAGDEHLVRLTNHGGPDFGPTLVPPDHYLVMGDNRGDSHDGRAFGLVTRDAILGRAFVVYWRGGLTWESL